MPGLEIIDQGSFRFRKDDGSESSASWYAAERTDISLSNDADKKFRLRIQIDTAETSAPITTAYKLQFRKNSGAWTTVTSSTSGIKWASSSNYTDHDATTKQLSTPLASTFVAGSIQTGDATTASIALNPSQFTEFEFMLTTTHATLVPGDVLEFRLIESGGATFNAYTQIPSLTISAGSAKQRTVHALGLGIGF